MQLRHRYPIADLLDLLGGAGRCACWSCRGAEPVPSSALRQARDEMSTSVLSQRLRELVDAGVADRGRSGYALTARGRELLELLGPLDAWAKRWAQSLRSIE